MTLKLQLLRDGEVIFEVPLSPVDWPKKLLRDEFKEAEEDFQKLSKIFDALSHETRLRMMRMLIEDDDLTVSFSRLMRDLELNPKTVWENARKLSESGLLLKTGRGRYRCSEFGQGAFMLMSLALRRLMELLEEMEET